ncbi:ribokinase [Primorskyibacter aestuariivivens]|uniref:ribokinase n=1 Tax=Primorskyibacter aestuariivivens TaxID=1888912 RepID=UPI002300865E|nr:ribokinase [Primorskyibacter aestuariivivens]MDA7427695.1 ribokinase [Primorskyibacter aestuariivivens]
MIFNLGSINADLFYRVPHLPKPGETLASDSYDKGLGGKGANMSVAAARAASRVVHIGAVGEDGRWAKDRLIEYGVDTRHIDVADVPTGHAIIIVDDSGENQIVLFPGANAALGEGAVTAALAEAGKDDWLLMQNETSLQGFTAALARQKGMRVAYAAAPFDAAAVEAVLPHVDLLVLNAVEAAQLSEAMGKDLRDLDVADIVVTLGGDGCRHISTSRAETVNYPAFDVKAVDATGAGDTFTGYLLAGLDRGMPMAQAITRAQKAAAIMVTRHGTADVIPDLKDLEETRF